MFDTKERLLADISGSVALLAVHFAGATTARAAMITSATATITFRAVFSSGGSSPEVRDTIWAWLHGSKQWSNRMPLTQRATVEDFSRPVFWPSPYSQRLIQNLSDWLCSNKVPVMDPSALPPINTSLGTVWCVKESLWKEWISHYDQRSTREMHFGLSMLRMPLALHSNGFVPMLHGRSEASRRCFWASGLSEEMGTDYKTYFGHLGPTQLPMSEISDNPTIKKSDLDVAWAYDCLRVRPNDHKHQLSSSEKEYLISWLKRNNLW
jgi:hypothetical protein